MYDQPYIIIKEKYGYKVLESQTSCVCEIPCEYCKDPICLKAENNYYCGFLITPNSYDQECVREDHIKLAYLLEPEEKEFIFSSIENITFLLYEYIHRVMQEKSSICHNSGYILKEDRYNLCVNVNSSEGEFTEYEIRDKSYVKKCGKYTANSIWNKFIDCETDSKIVNDLNNFLERNRLYRCDMFNPECVEISKDKYLRIKRCIQYCTKTIFHLTEMKYNILTLNRSEKELDSLL